MKKFLLPLVALAFAGIAVPISEPVSAQGFSLSIGDGYNRYDRGRYYGYNRGYNGWDNGRRYGYARYGRYRPGNRVVITRQRYPRYQSMWTY